MSLSTKITKIEFFFNYVFSILCLFCSIGCCASKKHHSSLLDIWSDKDPELCSCGCDQDLAEEDDEEEDFSDEDEGCFVITTVPPSNEPEEVTNKVNFLAINHLLRFQRNVFSLKLPKEASDATHWI